MCRAYGAYAGLQPGAYKRRSTRTRWRGKLAATGVKPSSDEAGGMMQKHEYRRIGWAAAAAFVLAAFAATLGSVAAQNENKALSQHAEKTQTKVILLGTGTPRPFPDRSGPATAIVVEDLAYLVDFGPGVVRRAAAAAERGTSALDPARITVAFATHLHSDHTAGLPDLILIPWVMGRNKFDVYGPLGTEEMTEHVLAAWHRDIEIRTSGLERRPPQAVHGHDVQPGVVYRNDKVT